MRIAAAWLYNLIVRVCMALTGALLILPGMTHNAFGFFTLEYGIAIWSPHMLLFIVIGPWTVWQLEALSQAAAAEAPDPAVQGKERVLTKFCYVLYVSFLFFALTLYLRPMNEKFSLLMIPKTFASMTAFNYLITGFLPPELRMMAR